MKPYKKVDIAEAHLEELVRLHPGLIEEGLVFLAQQVPTTQSGRLDVLLKDSGGALVIAELKVIEDDAMLFQALDYYDYVASNSHALSLSHQDKGIKPSESVRLLLVAPSFSQTLVNRCRWLNVPVSLFSFQCLQIEGETGVIPVYNEQSVLALPEAKEVTTLDDIWSYMTDPSVRELAIRFRNEVLSLQGGIVTDNAINFAVSFKVNGKVFAYLNPARKHFILQTYGSTGEWVKFKVSDASDLESSMPTVKASMESKSK